MTIVQPDCRNRFTAADFAFIVSALKRSPGQEEPLHQLLADPGTRDVLLDEDELFRAVLEDPGHLTISLELYLYVLVRRVLLENGLEDRELADYIAAVLAEHARRRGNPGARTIFYAVDLMEQISRSAGYERFALITQLGDQTLVLTGVFPEQVEYRARRKGAPRLDYYESIGTAHYRSASEHNLAQEFALNRIYADLSEAFGTVRTALNDMKERFLWLGAA